jgi:acyl carrier protein
VCDPFAGGSGARMYRSGDRARFRPAGEIEFLGRLDDEIKVRGHRIALGEIESGLGTHPHLSQAAVRFLEDRPGESRLVAYYTVRDDASLTDAELRDHLRRRLPEYMVPARFVRVERMPLTPNGKIDRRALPAPVPAGHQPEPDREGPRSRIEQEIAAVWSDVLGDEDFPSGESFFNLGGNSLHLVRVQTAVAQRLGVELDIVEFFRHPTIRQLGALIERRRRDPMSGQDAVPNRSAARLGMAADQQRQQHIRRGARARTRPERPQP